MRLVLSPYERQAIRDAVKEASERAKTYRRTWSLDRSELPQFEASFDDVEHARRVEGDSSDVFVDVLEDALRRRGGWIVFLE